MDSGGMNGVVSLLFLAGCVKFFIWLGKHVAEDGRGRTRKRPVYEEWEDDEEFEEVHPRKRYKRIN